MSSPARRRSAPRHDPSTSGGCSTFEFAEAARTLTRSARRQGLIAPSFRCPPGLVGVDRTIRRRAGGPVVAVRVRSRAGPAVLADMIEGVVVANELGAPAADRARNALWEAVVRAHRGVPRGDPVDVPAA